MRTLILLSAMAVAFITMSAAPYKNETPTNKSIAYASKDNIWTNFRKEFKYHMQTVGATEINSDESVTLIISEPPPHVTIKELKDKLKKYTFFIEEKTNKIGYDGWVKDLVIVINRIDKRGLNELISELNKYLYFTDYKSYAIDLPVKYKFDQFLPNLNYKIQISELNKWFFTDKEKLYPQDDSTAEYTLTSAFASGIRGIFYSKHPGFVLWLLKANDDISNKRETIRRFCLDADLIFGAVKNRNGGLAIIGRERLNNIYELPPLRTETIEMLASANKEEISQSYERRMLFAGKMSGGKDWAPIYLSQDLLNTEYGNLLNITDQMLKSWSSNGDIDYTDFNYTKPSYYSFTRSIRDVINTKSITFNWNTKGAGYTVNQGQNEFYCINRTGALPVTYIPEGLTNFDKSAVDKCEKRAYDYFAMLGNVDLARVVQYASLYQIFSRYNITSYANYYPASVTSQLPTSPLKNHLIDLINKVKDSDDEDLEIIADKIFADNFLYIDLRYDQIFDRLTAFKEDLNYYLSLFSHNAVDQFADLIINIREFKPQTFSDDDKAFAVSEFSRYARYLYLWKYILQGLTTEDLKDEYVKSRENYFARWVKTPSVVVSWHLKDSSLWEGGHNLGAKVTAFEVSETVAKGRIKVTYDFGIRNVLINQEDIANINPDILRTIAVDGKYIPEQLSIKDLSYTSRAIPDVLPVNGKRISRGLSENDIHITEAPTGFTINGTHVADCEELVANLTALIRKNKVENLQVHFEKIDESRAKALLKSSEIKLAGSEPNSTALLKSGEIFNINRTVYDFSKVKVTSDLVDAEIVIEIPKITDVKSRARLTISGFLMKAKNRIVTAVNRLLGTARDNDINFYKSLIDELKEYNIPQQSIEIEIDDCIICFNSAQAKTDGQC